MRLSTVAHHVLPFAALAGGILVLLMPRLLNYVIAGYLILVGVIGLNSLIISSANERTRRAGAGCDTPRDSSLAVSVKAPSPHAATKRSPCLPRMLYALLQAD